MPRAYARFRAGTGRAVRAKRRRFRQRRRALLAILKTTPTNFQDGEHRSDRPEARYAVRPRNEARILQEEAGWRSDSLDTPPTRMLNRVV